MLGPNDINYAYSPDSSQGFAALGKSRTEEARQMHASSVAKK